MARRGVVRDPRPRRLRLADLEPAETIASATSRRPRADRIRSVSMARSRSRDPAEASAAVACDEAGQPEIERPTTWKPAEPRFGTDIAGDDRRGRHTIESSTSVRRARRTCTPSPRPATGPSRPSRAIARVSSAMSDVGRRSRCHDDLPDAGRRRSIRPRPSCRRRARPACGLPR